MSTLAITGIAAAVVALTAVGALWNAVRKGSVVTLTLFGLTVRPAPKTAARAAKSAQPGMVLKSTSVGDATWKTAP